MWANALQFAADQSGDQDAEVRSLRAGCLHVLAHLRQRLVRRPGLGVERPLFPAAQLAKSRLVPVADQSRSKLHRQHPLRPASWQGQEIRVDWNTATNAILGDWQVTLIEKILSGFPVPLIDSFNQSGTTFNSGGNDNNYNRPNRVSGCDPTAANHSQHQWINSAALCRRAHRPARQCLARPGRRTRFREHRLLGNQRHSACTARRWV